jgi:hypothetical protein
MLVSSTSPHVTTVKLASPGIQKIENENAMLVLVAGMPWCVKDRLVSVLQNKAYQVTHRQHTLFVLAVHAGRQGVRSIHEVDADVLRLVLH